MYVYIVSLCMYVLCTHVYAMLTYKVLCGTLQYSAVLPKLPLYKYFYQVKCTYRSNNDVKALKYLQNHYKYVKIQK